MVRERRRHARPKSEGLSSDRGVIAQTRSLGMSSRRRIRDIELRCRRVQHRHDVAGLIAEARCIRRRIGCGKAI